MLGNFVGVGHVGRGSVRFTVQNGVGRLDFSADFAVSAVPGPFVYLNTTNNANAGRPLRVAALKSNSGAQTTGVRGGDSSYALTVRGRSPICSPLARTMFGHRLVTARRYRVWPSPGC